MLRGELPGRSFVRGQLFGGGQFSSGAIILGDNYPGIDHPGGNFRGVNYPDTYILMIYIFIYLFIYLFIHLFIYLFIYSFILYLKLTNLQLKQINTVY